jgi:choline dehydrogenase
MIAQAFPEQSDVLIVGGGTSGAALAGIIARDTALSVVLLEAGPDHGPYDGGRWPAELLDARRFGLTHDWGCAGVNHPSQTEPGVYPRARVIGGCSAHNGCVAVVGHRRDYDAWAELGLPGWDWDSVAPAFERAKQAMRVRIPDDAEVQPFHRAYLQAAIRAGHARVSDLNDPDIVDGVAPAPFNISDGVRWNTALAYLDPVRERRNLTVVPNALVERVIIDGERAVAVEASIAGARQTLRARRIVLSAGAYGTPAILLRSGIGEPAMLRDLGITVTHALPGVGRGLTDHPITHITLRPSAKLQAEMDAFQAERWTPDEQVVLLTRSRRCHEAFDLHMPAFSTCDPTTGEWRYQIAIAQWYTRSSGALTLTSADPTALPHIDHGYLTDPDGIDRDVLVDGLELGLEIAEQIIAAGAAEAVTAPDPAHVSRSDLARHAESTVTTCYHPSCSCRMGPASDPQAVVDADGRVHGLTGLYVCDASIFPVIPRANTNLPAAMAAEHLAGRIAG